MKKTPRNNQWEEVWKDLEHAGNIGIRYCINPVLYPVVVNTLLHKNKAIMIDFGAGTNNLGHELLLAQKNKIHALRNISQLPIARTRVSQFVGLEQSSVLINAAKKKPPKLVIKKWDAHNPIPLKSATIDLAISRNFIMHLSIPEMKFHLAEVARTLKPRSEYILSVLNPDYEVRRNSERSGAPLQNGKQYEFARGSMENTMFVHYFKTTETLESSFNESLTIAAKRACFPITAQFKKSHERYYWEDCPMAYVYKLVKHG